MPARVRRSWPRASFEPTEFWGQGSRGLPVRLASASHLIDVAGDVTERAAPIPVGRVERILDALSAGIDGSAVRRVRIVNVDVKERREGFPSAGDPPEGDRVSDTDLGRPPWLDLGSGGEDCSEKGNRFR